MKRCSACGCEIEDKCKFCPECGHATSLSAESAAERSLGDVRTMLPRGVRVDDVSLGGVPTMAPVQSAAETGGVKGAPLSERYELLEIIGKGGFARVWRARDKKLGRTVAVKRLLPLSHISADDQTLARFRREAQAIAQLNHRNIVAVYDHDCDAEGEYIVMEFVGGGTLRDYLSERGGRLPVVEAVELIRGIVQGLDHAHRNGLVHRDIKPANILLQEQVAEGAGAAERIPKIVDFGLARVGADTGVSLSGYGMGTPAYMPPEQRRDAKNVNQCADIFAVGKTLYEMVSGDLPENVDEEKIPPVPGLSGVIRKCVKNNPAERYFSARELLDALEQIKGSKAEPQNVSSVKVNECPVCGAATRDGMKFCEGCGAGLTRACPECGRENSVQKQFCGGCGTEVSAFLGAQESLSRMAKYAEEKRWSRIQKEYGAVPSCERLTGPKGRELKRSVDALAADAQDALKERDRLDTEFRALSDDAVGAVRGLSLIDAYREVDPYRDWGDLPTRYAARIDDSDYDSAMAESSKVADVSDFDSAVAALDRYLSKHPAGAHADAVRGRIADTKTRNHEAEDDAAFERLGVGYDACVKAERYRAAEKLCDDYCSSFKRHAEEAGALREKVVALDEARIQRVQKRTEHQLRRLRMGVAIAAVLACVALAARAGLSWWRIRVFEGAVGEKDLESAQQASRRLVWFYPQEQAQKRVSELDVYLGAHRAYEAAVRSGGDDLPHYGGRVWTQVKGDVAAAEATPDLIRAAQALTKSAVAVERLTGQIGDMLAAREGYRKLVGDNEKALSQYGGESWSAVAKVVAESEGAQDLGQAEDGFKRATAMAREVVDACKEAITARTAFETKRKSQDEAFLTKYASEEWRRLCEKARAADSEKEAEQVGERYMRMSAEIDTVGKVAAARAESEKKMLSAQQQFRTAFAATDVKAAQRLAKKEWESIVALSTAADRAASDLSSLAQTQTTYETALKAVGELDTRLTAVDTARRQFEKKIAAYAAEADEISRLADGPWRRYLDAKGAAESAADPETCVRLYRTAGDLLEKAVDAADDVRRNRVRAKAAG